jgi:hypothetical protein
LIIGFVIFGLSISILQRFNTIPDVELPVVGLQCPDVEIEITEQDFHRSLMQAKSGCRFNATLMFHPSDEILNDEARVLGLVDAQGNPTLLRTDNCDLPFEALILCNGTLFPGDKVMIYSNHGVVIQKTGR